MSLVDCPDLIWSRPPPHPKTERAYARKAQYTFVASSLIDDEGIENYAAIIVRNDNPELSAIISEFTTTISLLSTKP